MCACVLILQNAYYVVIFPKEVDILNKVFTNVNGIPISPLKKKY